MVRLHHPRVFPAVVLAALSFVGAPLAWASERVALLIGNSEYREPAGSAEDTGFLPRIPMPAKDIRLMEAMLLKAGFACTTVADRTTSEMRKDVESFAAKYKGAPVVLFYYSGHGLQQDGVNYLAGVDARLDVSEKLSALGQARRAGALSAQEFEAALTNLKRRNAQEQLLPLEEVLQSLNAMSVEPGHRKIVLLDACRDPFALTQKEKKLLAMKSAAFIGKGAMGLAKPAERRGMFIGFSASAGEVSLGVPTEPSLFTRIFCQEALKPGVTLRDAFDEAAQKVYEESARLISVERKAAATQGQALEGVLAQEAQTPAAYSIIFPGGFAFIPKTDGRAADLTSPPPPALEAAPRSALAGMTASPQLDAAAARVRQAEKEGYRVQRINEAGLLEFKQRVSKGDDCVLIVASDHRGPVVNVWVESEVGNTVAKDVGAQEDRSAEVRWRSEYDGEVNVVVAFPKATEKVPWLGFFGAMPGKTRLADNEFPSGSSSPAERIALASLAAQSGAHGATAASDLKTMAKKYSLSGYRMDAVRVSPSDVRSAAVVVIEIPVRKADDVILLVGAERRSADVDIWIESEVGRMIVKDTRQTGNSLAGVRWRSEYTGTVKVAVRCSGFTGKTALAVMLGQRTN